MTKVINSIAKKISADGWLVNQTSHGASITFVWFDELDIAYFWRGNQWEKQVGHYRDTIANGLDFQYADDKVPPVAMIILGILLGWAFSVIWGV